MRTQSHVPAHVPAHVTSRAWSRTLLALTATGSLVLAGAAAAPAVPAGGAGAAGASTATARVFMVNPVQSSTAADQGQGLADDKDAAAAVPASAYATVDLTHLDGSGYLSGDYVTVESTTGRPAFSRTGEFAYDRSQDQFEQVMAYYWITQAQAYLQSLGFTGQQAILDEPVAVRINQLGGDNSYQTDKPARLRFGKGGVDDAEDAEVVVHEYGHAVQADQVPGFGVGVDAGAIGEGFSDYLAVSVGLHVAAAEGWPVRGATPGEVAAGWEARACVADWDATSYYGGTAASCLRRLDQDGRTVATRAGEIYQDSMIWSGALWRIRQAYAAAGLAVTDWDRTLVAAQFDFAPDTSFAAAARATVARALAADGPVAAEAARAEFVRRGILG